MAGKKVSLFTLQYLLVVFVCITVSTTMAACPTHCACTKRKQEDGGGENIVCSGKRLVTLPKTPSSTVSLDLSYNLLGPELNSSFTHYMSRLEDLDLSYNGLDRLFACTLSSMVGLKRLSFRGNMLKELPESLFEDNEKLERLDLAGNQLTDLTFDFLRNLANLKSLDASSNKFTSLSLGSRFKVPINIEYLDLSFNNFDAIGADAFVQATHWTPQVARALRLRQCKLDSIHSESLKKIPNLNTLDVSGNPGVSVETWKGAFANITSLEHLSLADCRLSTLAQIFNNGISTQALKSLNISNNSISDISANTFRNEFTLRVLDMSHNEMEKLTVGFNALKNLEALNLSSNVMTEFKGAALSHMTKLHSVWLGNNRLAGDDSVHVEDFILKELVLHNNRLTAVPLPTNTSLLEILDVHSNLITVIPQFADVENMQHVDFSHNNLETLHAYLFQKAHFIKVARFSHNKITNVHDNAFMPQSPLVLDLSHNALADLNTPHWVATQEISLASNQLTSLSPSTFYGMKGMLKMDISRNKIVFLHENLFQQLDTLVYLDISHNQLAGKNKDGVEEKIYWTRLFRNLASLKNLHMGHNNISTLEPESFTRLESLQNLYLDHNKLATVYPILFRDQTELRTLDLSGNPYDCSCDLLAFRDWLSRTRIHLLGIEVVGANSTYNCLSPSSRKGLHVKGWTTEEFECNQSTFYLIVFGCLAVFLIIAAVVGVGLLRIYRQHRDKKKENQRRRARILRELEEVQRGKYGTDKEEELVLVSREIAAEIEDALERKKKLGRKQEDTKVHKGGYIPWPIGSRKGYKRAEELGNPEEDPVKNKSWGDGLDRQERREAPQPRIDDRGNQSSDWPAHNGRPTGHVEKTPQDRVIPRVVKLDQHYPYVVREAVPVVEKVDWAPTRPRHQEDRYRYRPEPMPRQTQRPYAPYDRDITEPAQRPAVWTTANDYRPTKYWTLPNSRSREEIRYGDDMRIHYRPDQRQAYQDKQRGANVRFEDPRYYPEPRPGSYEYWRRNRSLSHGYLGADHEMDGPSGRDRARDRSLSQGYLGADHEEGGRRGRDRAQRQYESIDQHHGGRDGLGRRSSSQPALAHASTSGWL